jgi:type IV pilus assembly protein PilW
MNVRINTSRGYSLIELSVAIGITLFLTAGLIGLAQGTRRAYGTQNQLARLQDQQRLAMTFLVGTIEQAGFFPDPVGMDAADQFPISSLFLTPGQSIAGTSTDTAQGDTLTVRYVSAGGDGVMDCAGGSTPDPAPNPVLYENTFKVDAAKNELRCSANGAEPVTLATGIQGMAILYGVKTDVAVTDNRVDSYLPAKDMLTIDWGNIVTIRITLDFINPLYGQPGQTQKTIPFTRVIGVMRKAGVQT